MPQGRLFAQMLEMLRFYDGFEVNDYTGVALSEMDISDIQSKKIQNIQLVAFQNFKEELSDLALGSSSSVENRENLQKHLSHLSNERLQQLAEQLGLIHTKEALSRDYIEAIVASYP
jgi:intron-binding protein aquarius